MKRPRPGPAVARYFSLGIRILTSFTNDPARSSGPRRAADGRRLRGFAAQ